MTPRRRASCALADEAATNPATTGRSRRAGIAVGTLGVLVALIAGSAYWHFGHRGSAAIRAGRYISPALASSSVEEFATKGDSVTPQLLWYPAFDPIRNDPRFKTVLKKIGLPYRPRGNE